MRGRQPMTASAHAICVSSRNELPTGAIPLPSLLATGFGRTVSFLNPGLGQSETGIEKLLYGLSEKTTKSKNLQAQTPQADERKPPQEAFALQVVNLRAASRPAKKPAPPFVTRALICVRSRQHSPARPSQVTAAPFASRRPSLVRRSFRQPRFAPSNIAKWPRRTQQRPKDLHRPRTG